MPSVRSVDVCIPSYNYGRFLAPCVASVLAQAAVSVRVLIIDDTSSDDTPAIGSALAASDPRVEYRRHAVNAGHLATYNEGIHWAAAEYFALLSADDLLTPGSLGRALSLMESHPDVGMVHGSQISFWFEDPPAAAIDDRTPGTTVIEGQTFVAQCCAGGINPVSMPTVVVRTAVQKQVGGFRAALPHTGDLEMWMRIAGSGHAIGYIAAPQAFRRRHDAAMHLDYTATGLRDLEQHVAAFDSYFADPACASPRNDALGAITYATLGEQAFWRASQSFDRGDLATCAAFLEMAATLKPAVRHTRSWALLAVKRRIGHPVWRRLLAAVTHQ